MKSTFPLLATACAALLVGAANVQAQYSSDVNPAPAPRPGPRPGYGPGPGDVYYAPYFEGPLYAGVELGGTLMQDMHVKNNGSKIDFNPGTRFGFNFGAYVAPPLSFEFETGVIWNSIHRDGNQPLTANGHDAELYQVPLLVNMVLHIPLGGGCQAYIGGGGGGVVSDLYTQTGNHHDDYSADSDVTLAYQAMAGFKWPVARRMEVGVGYKFMGTMDHTWFNGDPVLFTHSSPAYSHSILASFTFVF